MRLLVLTILISLYNFSFSQESENDTCEIPPFEVYLDDNDEFSNIRESPNGEIVLKINGEFTYGYVFNVIDYKNGWLKINEMRGVNEITVTNFEGWIHTSIVGAAVTYSFDVLDEPNGKIKVGRLIGEQDTLKIKEVYCEWIKIECNDIVGWVKSSKICGNPVTTCS